MTSETILLRQVHPQFASEGELTSQAFFPFPKDNGKLSVYNGDQIIPAQAHAHYVRSLGFESIGVWGVTCAEVSIEGLKSEASPVENSPCHAHIDFEGRDPKTCRKLAKKLRDAARERGCLFRAN